MPLTAEQIDAACAAVEAQRALLGPAATDAALAALAAQREALLAAEAAAPQLKQVSILFLDVVGSTTLSQRLDPEDINAVMDGALEAFTALVQAQHGRVLQYAGDSVLAVFGAPRAREDDAERAVLAGLALLAEGRRRGEQLFDRFAHEGFGVRVGIHTGGVLLGGGVDGEHTIRGIAVNVAARMEQSAPPGSLRISQDTWRHVRGRFEFAEQPPLSVKGVDEPLRTWLVLGPCRAGERAAVRGVEGVASPLVGRAGELARLASLHAALCQAPDVAAVTVVAEAGLGKSRLAAEWRASLAPERWLEARATEQMQSVPYAALRQWLSARIDLLDSDTPARARSKWLEAAAARLASEADAAVLGHLIGFDFTSHAELAALAAAPRQLRDRAFFHAAQWLQAQAREQNAPLLLVLDDAHWADDGTLDFAAHLASAPPPDARLLVVALARPTLFERRADWGRAFARHERIDLVPLDAAQSGALADALLARVAGLPEALRRQLVERAGGNPFYLEELVNMLIDHGAIVAAGDTWQFDAARADALPLPSTLVGVLQARLDALPEGARRTAQLAAVVGFRFWDASLAALGAPLPEGLQGLIEREIALAADESRLAGAREYAFAHHLPYQVSYDSILKRARQRLHAQVAQWLQAQPGEPALELIAEHFERGGDAAHALEHWQRAAEAAAARYANAQALAHLQRAFALAPADDLARRYALQLLRCRVLEVLSEHAQLPVELDLLLSLAELMGDAERESQALRRYARHRYDSGQITEALALAERAFECAPASAPERAAHASALRAQCLQRLGQHASARQESQRALRLARACADRVTEAMVLNDLGLAADEAGDAVAAIGHYEQALALHRALGNRVNEGGTLANLAYARMTLADHAGAARGFEQALRLSQRIGQRQNEGITRINLAIAQLRLGDVTAADAQAEQAAALLADTRDRWAEAAALRVWGQTALAQARFDAAEQRLAASQAMFEQMALPHLALESRAARAEAALVRGDAASALAHAQAVAAQWDSGASLDGTEEPLRLLWVCWRALAQGGDARAEPLRARALAMLDERAARIADAAARRAFLDALPEHRELRAGREGREGAATGS